jgi:hypothetical protein
MRQSKRMSTPVTKKSSVFIHLISTVIGLLLLIATIPMRWLPSNVLVNEWRILIRSGLDPIDEIFSLPILYIIISALLLMILLIWKNRTLNHAWINLKVNNKNLHNLLFAAVIFGLTIFPLSLSKEILNIDQSYTIYLIIGTYGVLLFVYGIYPFTKGLTRIINNFYQLLMKIPIGYFLLICAGFVFLFTNLISFIAFQQKPHLDDTIAQLFQARIFAQGKLYWSAPSFPEFFDRGHIVLDNGRWYSQYPPCHPAILTLGVLIGMPWIINPLLGALAVIIFYFLGKELFDKKTGRIAALLGTLSPFLLFMSSEYMNHASALLFLSCFILFFFQMIRKHSFLSALLAGSFLGLAVNVRPLSALAISTPLIIYSLFLVFRNFKQYFSRLILLGLGTAFFVGILLYYNYLTNGNPFTFGYIARWGSDHGLGFGRSGWGPIHTPLRALLSTSEDLNALNRFLFEWPIPSLIFIALLFASGQAKRKEYLLLAIISAPVVAYFFYWYHGILFGPRWEYETLGALVVLTSCGILILPDFILNKLKIPTTREKITNGLKTILIICYASMILIAIPTLTRYYATGFKSTRFPIIEQANESQLKNAVVATPKLIYASAFGGNQLDLKGDVVYVRDLPPLLPLLRTVYPDRRYYRALGSEIFEIDVPNYPESPLYEALQAQSEFTKQLINKKYRTLFWPATNGWKPFRSLLADTTINILSLRQFYIDIYAKKYTLDELLPALVFWIFNDRNDHIQIFAFMDDAQSYIAADYKFTLKYVTPNELGAVYEIDKVTGEENIIHENNQ